MNILCVYVIDGIVLVVDFIVFVYLSVVLIGDVIVGLGCYVGFCVSLCGDFGCLIFECGVNLQDICVMYGFFGIDIVVEEDGYIGYGVVLYGCCIGCNVLVGMNVVIMDNVVIGELVIVVVSVFVKVGVEILVCSFVVGMLVKVIW